MIVFFSELSCQNYRSSVKNCTKDLKVKAKSPLTEFLETVKTTLAELERSSQTENLRYQLMHMRDILERWKIVGRKYSLCFGVI